MARWRLRSFPIPALRLPRIDRDVLAQSARGARRAVCDLLFPPFCAVCEAELEPAVSSLLICDFCRDEMRDAAPRCERCGLVSDGAAAPCKCAGRRFAFEKVYPLGTYKGKMRECVLRMKHAEEAPLASAMAEWIHASLGDAIREWRPDLVVPVPMHWRRRLARRHNSPTAIARTLARRLEAPLSEALVRRARATRPQVDLRPAARAANVRGAFAVKRRRAVDGRRIVIVDDVMTTGATCHEVARTLRAAGASALLVVVAARAQD